MTRGQMQNSNQIGHIKQFPEKRTEDIAIKGLFKLCKRLWTDSKKLQY
jgi:hypothetical protein